MKHVCNYTYRAEVPEAFALAEGFDFKDHPALTRRGVHEIYNVEGDATGVFCEGRVTGSTKAEVKGLLASVRQDIKDDLSAKKVTLQMEMYGTTF